MAEQIISPGVFTQENDLSFLPQGIGAIGAAIVGPTEQGPAFIPTLITSFTDFRRIFGDLSKDTYIPQTAREYLKNAGAVTIVRVLAGGGYTFSNGTTEPVALVATTQAAGTFTCLIASDGDNSIGIQVPSTIGGGGTAVTMSLDSDQTTAPVGEAANAMAIGTQNMSALNVAEILTIAINGGAHDNIDYATSGVGTAGVAGVSASHASNTLTITADTGSIDGNNIVLSMIGSGTTMSPSAMTSGSSVLLSLLYPSKNSGTGNLGTSFSSLKTTNTVQDAFKITLQGADGSRTFSGSLNPNNLDYVPKNVGYSPDNSKTATDTFAGTPGYTYINFKKLQTDLIANSNAASLGYGTTHTHINQNSKLHFATAGSTNVEFKGYPSSKIEGYGQACTPWIQGQIALGRKDLFKFHTLNPGADMATKYKISIQDLKEPSNIDGQEQYSRFSVIIRHNGDTDGSIKPIETFTNVTLDPNSPRYIAKQIGDKYPDYNETLNKVEILGNYNNISKHIRVEVSNEVKERATSPKLSPKGFKAVFNPYKVSGSALSISAVFPSASYEGLQQTGTDSVYSVNGYLGWKSVEKADDNPNFLRPLPNSPNSNIAGAFSVENYEGHPSSSLWLGSLSASVDPTGATGPKNSQIKFTVPFQGGDNGLAPWTIKKIGSNIETANLYGFNLSNSTTSGSIAYKKAIDILANQDEYDINMLALPGVIKTLHSTVTSHAIDMCENRGDTFYVMDLNTQDATVNAAVNATDTLDSNYTAVYYPWVRVFDDSQGLDVYVPPSVIIPGAIAKSDNIGAEWFAPAGLNRGRLGNVSQPRHNLTQAERDVLYDAKINPIASFPGIGPCIWGQKTLQERSTALDRINVRRLLINLKKFIASSSKYLVFEQNTTQTRNRFLNIVNPYLESIQQQQGLFAFRVLMDESNNTPTVIDRNQLVGAIYLQPTKTAEYIIIDFNVLPTGATFPA